MSRFLVGIVVEHGRMIEVIIEAKDHGDARIRAEAIYGKGKVAFVNSA
jgi:hypothetical protein